MPLTATALSYESAHRYMEGLLCGHTPSLSVSIREKTVAAFPEQAHMLLGHLGGHLLSFFVQLLQPSTVLELGTFTGYSATYLLEHLPPSSRLYTVEKNPLHLECAKRHLAAHPKYSQITFVEDDATAFLSSFDQRIDLAFVDANKASYETQYHLLLERLHPKGVILVDNLFFHGEVFDPQKSKIASAVHRFNQMLAEDKTVVAVPIPLRDGMWIITQKNKT